ncbi:MAG: glycine cleavage system protein GcvH [Actinomycetota bacterium]|nr:glycine cleavage system protein GcvH [Actinomycetota bacterium]
MSELDYPDTVRYTSDHEWVAETEDGTVRVGITAYAQDALGDVVYVSLPLVGDLVTAGESCGEVESTKSVSDIYAPVSGEVTAINGDLDATPELVNSAPYDGGWMYEVRPTDGGLPEGLMDSAAYQASLG